MDKIVFRESVGGENKLMNIHSDSEEIKRQIFQNFQNIQTRLEPVEEGERERC